MHIYGSMFKDSELSLLGTNSDSDNSVDEYVLNSPLLSNAAKNKSHFEKYCNHFVIFNLVDLRTNINYYAEHVYKAAWHSGSVRIFTVGVDTSDNGRKLHDTWGIYIPMEMLAYSEGLNV
jgi:hypothetical protein